MARRNSRNVKQIQLAPQIFILCEGETEVNYFLGLKVEYHLTALVVDKPIDHSPKGLVKEGKEILKAAKARKDKDIKVWVVFDKDQHQNIPEALHQANALGINIAFSVISFEYWFLLHFEQTTRPHAKCDDLISHLKKHYTGYEKAESHYKNLKSRQETAMVNAAFVEKQNQNDLNNGVQVYELGAYTDVHLMINKLLEK